MSDSALSQRRSNLCWDIFEAILEVALKPRAQEQQHPSAFYAGPRLCGIDGSQFSVANTPQVKEKMKKARKAGKRKRGKRARSRAGSCGTYMYWNKKTRRCADARNK